MLGKDEPLGRGSGSSIGLAGVVVGVQCSVMVGRARRGKRQRAGGRLTGDDEYAPTNLGTRPGRRCWTAVRKPTNHLSISIYLLSIYLSSSLLIPEGVKSQRGGTRG